jgi:predicted amidohydrolase YtcJ
LPAADVVLHSGQILTIDHAFSIAEAIVIADGDIVAVGPTDAIRAWIGADTVVVDLEGRTVMPGFVDPHTHHLQSVAPDLDAMRAAQRFMLEGGTTSIGSPHISPDQLEAFQTLDANGDLVTRNHLYTVYNTFCDDRDIVVGYLGHDFSQDPDLRLAVAGVKVFADGGACRAPAISHPYLDTTPDGLKERGFVGNGDLYVSADEIATVVADVDAAGGITVIHAIGDLGLREALHGLAMAYEEKPFTHHQRIDHNSLTTLLTPEELAIYGQVGMVPVVFGARWANGCDLDVGELWQSILPGPVLSVIENSAALRAANPGMRVSWHGDAPSIPGQPFQLMFTFVTGGAVDLGTGEPCYPPLWDDIFVVDVAEALRMMTLNAAAAMEIDDRVGSLEVGKVADLLILESDPFDADHEAGIATNRPLATMIDGVVHYCDGDLCSQLESLRADNDTGRDVVGPEGLAVTASTSRDLHTPELVLDGSADGESFWSSGADPPGWIEVSFVSPSTVVGVRMVVFQSPPSETVHVLEVRVGGEWTEVETFAGFTTTGDVLEWTPGVAVEGVDRVRITTLESLSWPEWYEIEIDLLD